MANGSALVFGLDWAEARRCRVEVEKVGLASCRGSSPCVLAVRLVLGGNNGNGSGPPLWVKLYFCAEGVFNKAGVASFRDPGVNSSVKTGAAQSKTII